MATTLRVLAILPDDVLRHALQEELSHIPNLSTVRTLTELPKLDELLRTIRVQKPDFLLLEVEDFPSVNALLGNMEDLLPGLPVIGVAQQVDEGLAHKLMHLGIREYMVPPFTREKLIQIADFLEKQFAKHPRPLERSADLYTFFPAKPGVGCTTIALSVSCALAEELSVPTLLLDGDLAAGIVNFHLKLGNTASILDAMSHAENLDEGLWQQMVGKRDKLEVLHAGSLVPLPHIDVRGLQRVLSLARAQYQVICADLGSNLDEFSIELLRESQRIFLVTTPEVASVHLAQARIKSLGDLGLADRVSLVLNRKDRWHSHLDPNMVAEAVGIPVAFTIANDYESCTEATIAGRTVPGRSEVGRSILELAHSLRTETHSKTVSPGYGRKFLEFFHVPHVPDPTTVWRS
jgi:pilus assembly protein CpaE